jgi:putative lipoic acid-binding regulatory protein
METLSDKNLPKLELDYPCSWTYKLIGHEKEAIQKAIHEVILEREHDLSSSKASKTGKYVSMNLSLVITNEDERNFIFKALKAHQNIKMVL